MSFTVELQPPPSVNNLFANRKDGRGRFKTSAYHAWQRMAALTIVSTVRADQRVGGGVAVKIELPSKCRLDIDNAAKAILDALVVSRRIDDDRNVQRLEIVKNARSDALALVTVRKAESS